MRDQLIRQWQIVTLLSGHRRGLRSIQIARELGVSRQSVDRDLRLLRNAGVQITTETIGGEKRHQFASKPLPPLQPTALQLAALQVARMSLKPLEGSRLLREIDTLLGSAPAERPLPGVTVRAGLANPEVVKVLDSAIEHKRRVRLKYAAASHAGEARSYEVDPISLRLVKQDLYLAAYDRASQSAHRFKVLRVREATFLEEKADAHPDLDEATLFGRGIKVWSGDLHNVVVTLKSQVAHLANEYPLATDQTIEVRADGTVRIQAKVAGLVEAKQWVLGWGSAAVAIEPPELREDVKAELTKAIAEYEGPEPKPAHNQAKARPSVATARRAELAQTGPQRPQRNVRAAKSAQTR